MTHVPFLVVSLLMCEVGSLNWSPRALLASLEICAN